MGGLICALPLFWLMNHPSELLAQLGQLGLGEWGFQLFDQGADEGLDVEAVQGAGSQRDAQRGFAGGDGGWRHGGLLAAV